MPSESKSCVPASLQPLFKAEKITYHSLQDAMGKIPANQKAEVLAWLAEESQLLKLLALCQDRYVYLFSQPWMKDSHGNTVAHHAVTYPYFKLNCKFTLLKYILTMQNNNQETPLEVLIKKGGLDNLKQYFDKNSGVLPDSLVGTYESRVYRSIGGDNREKHTLASFAVIHGQQDILQYVLEQRPTLANSFKLKQLFLLADQQNDRQIFNFLIEYNRTNNILSQLPLNVSFPIAAPTSPFSRVTAVTRTPIMATRPPTSPLAAQPPNISPEDSAEKAPAAALPVTAAPPPTSPVAAQPSNISPEDSAEKAPAAALPVTAAPPPTSPVAAQPPNISPEDSAEKAPAAALLVSQLRPVAPPPPDSTLNSYTKEQLTDAYKRQLKFFSEARTCRKFHGKSKEKILQYLQASTGNGKLALESLRAKR